MFAPLNTKHTPEVISDYRIIVANVKPRNSQVKASAGGFSAENRSLAEKRWISSPSSTGYSRAAAVSGGSDFMASWVSPSRR